MSRVLDRTTGAAGLLVLGLALLGPLPPWQAWAALPVIVLAARRPLMLPTAGSESLVIGLDSALLIALGLTLPLREALLVWCVCVVVSELTMARSLDTRLFNSGICILSGVLALGLLDRVPAPERTGPLGLLASGAAAAAYFAADYVWSAVSVAVAERASLRRMLHSRGLLLAFACFLAVDSLGFLAAVVLQAKPWAVVLLTLPFVSLLLATHSWSQLRRTEQQSGALSAAAVALQAAGSPDEVERLLLEHAARLVRAPSAGWRDGSDPPGLPFVSGPQTRELVVAARLTGEGFTAQDTEALRILLGVAEQAVQRLALLAELRRSAMHDPLTGLANRSAFHEALTAAVTGSDGIAVLYCDLDGFKQVNDGRGHAAGDALLVAVAARLRGAVRSADLPVRLGGDEFAVLLRELGPEAAREAVDVAQRISASLASPYEIPGGHVVVPASIGLCVRAADELAEELLHASDAAMYTAKARGGGQVHVHGVHDHAGERHAAGPAPL